MTFSEVVQPSTLVDFTKITLQSSSSSLANSVNLTWANVTAISGERLQLGISKRDMDAVQTNRFLAISTDTTFISLVSGLVLDIGSNPSAAILSSSALRTAQFTTDVVLPRLESFNLALASNTLVLRFSEVVNASSLQTFGITLQNERLRPTESYTLSSSSFTSSSDDVQIDIQLSTADINAIKALERLAVSNSSVYIATQPFTIADMYGNLLTSISTNDALRVSDFNFDILQPQLTSFDMNATSGELLLHFDETILASSIQIGEFVLENGQGATYALTTSSRHGGENTADVTITLGADDLNALKLLGICSSASTCYLRHSNVSATDAFNHYVVGGFSNVSIFTRDTVQPELISFSAIDLAAGTITLSFSEAIPASAIDPKGLVLQTLFQNALSSYRLTGGTVSASGVNITIALTAADLVAIKQDRRLCTYRATCYLTAQTNAAADFSSNALVPIPDGSPGKIAQLLVADSRSPVLGSFDLDLNSGNLTLTFDEPLDPLSVDVTQLVLQATKNSSDGKRPEQVFIRPDLFPSLFLLPCPLPQPAD